MNITLFSTLENKIAQLLSTFPSAKVLWGGDFNTVIDESMDRWPPREKQINELENVCDRISLINIWRHRNLDKKAYTWSNKDGSLQSRIDFWLISSDIENKEESVTIEPTVHKSVTIRINMGTRSHNSNSEYWKLNKTLIHDKEFKKKAQEVIDKYWKQAKILKNFGQWWEQMKFEIRNLAILVSKKLSKMNKEKEFQIVGKIMSLSGRINLSEDEVTELTTAQAELDKAYADKARGAFVRSRRKWLEQGEKCTKYFFNLEKRNFEQSSLSKLRINDLICDDKKQISEFVANF